MPTPKPSIRTHTQTANLTQVLAQHNGRAVIAFELRLEDLLNKQHAGEFIMEVGKLKLDVKKTLVFLNERMRF